MLNFRTAAAVIALLLVGALLAAFGDGGEAERLCAGADSFGTRFYGWRGIYATLEKLGLPVVRDLRPPSARAATDKVRVVWAADEDFAASETLPLRELRRWAEAGGIVAVAPPYPKPGEHSSCEGSGLRAVLPPWLGTTLRLRPPRRPENGERIRLLRRDYTQYTALTSKLEDLAEQINDYLVPRVYRLSGSGVFADIAARAPRITLSDNLQILFFDRHDAPADVLYANDGDRVFPIAAEIPCGRGRVRVFSDPTLLYNMFLGRESNAVLAVALLTAPGRTTVFDEFFHGHAAAKPPYRLFTEMPYAPITLALLVFLAVLGWRTAVRFGPPLREKPASRRTLGEYLAAMGRLLSGENARAFVLRECVSGALQQYRRRHGLRPGGEAEVAAHLARRDPARAARFLDAARDCERLAALPEPPPEAAARDAVRRLLRECGLTDFTEP